MDDDSITEVQLAPPLILHGFQYLSMAAGTRWTLVIVKETHQERGRKKVKRSCARLYTLIIHTVKDHDKT